MPTFIWHINYIHKINYLGLNIKTVFGIKGIFITTKTFSIQSLLGTIDRLGCQAQIGQSWQGWISGQSYMSHIFDS